MSWREPPNVKVDGCFYSGNVFDEPSSVVTVSLCDGIVSILFRFFQIKNYIHNYFMIKFINVN